MSDLKNLTDITSEKVKDKSGKIATSDFERNVLEAIKRYSRHRPNTSVVDVTGNGTHDYSLPTGWIEGFSSLVSIEYPVDNVPADYLDQEDYEIYQTTTVKKVRLITYSPAATDSFRVTFTIPRTDTTILDPDEDAVCNLAASLCLEELANVFIHSSDSSIAADSVDYRDKAYKASQRAKRMLQLYKEHLGIKEDDITPPASAVKDLDMKYPGGAERLTHPRWRREKR